MSELIYELMRSSVALFVVVDPLGNVPILLGLTSGMSTHERRRVLNKAIMVGSLLLLVFALAGQQLLLLFGITLHSFMIAGGILLLLLATKILISGGESDTWRSRDVGAFPIAFPLLAGPGAITTSMITIHSVGHLVAIISIAIVMFLTWLIIRGIDGVYSFLGKVGADVVARVMAVFISAIAIEYIMRGLQFYYPAA